jgi:hypothetical protein
MLTNNLILKLTSNLVDEKISLAVRDRSNTIINLQTFTENTKLLCFDMAFPNTLFIDIYNDQSQPISIELSELKLSGLDLPIDILDQICHFTPQSSESNIVTRKWHSQGLVQIDFFAADWVQYHLLYGNKIQLNKK